tara:strand:+ start:1888 stop:2658 length:771 start_codon:yes stop_codon:yes gene_type:complete
MIDRNEMIQELKLREFIKRAIRVRAANKKQSRIWEEHELRSIIRKLLKEAPTEKVQHRSTGINVLEDLLKKIIPVIEQDYKMLTTDVEQRKSFSAHITVATENALAPVMANKEAGAEDDKFIGISEIENINEIEVEIGERPEDDDAFIDIDADEKEEEEEGNFENLGDEDKTGANFAQATFDKIEKQIIDAYSLLSNEEDQKLFYDYLITNIKLYFDKFEAELDPDIAEPTTDEYEDEKDNIEGEEELGGEEELEL